MFPLGQPQVGMFPDFLSGFREFLCIGHAVDPDRPGSEELAEAQGEIARRGPRGDDHVRAMPQDGEKDLGKAGRAVEAALAASTQGRPTAFAVLSGAEEARLEFRAVNAALPGVGVLAGGGKSLQVASSVDDAASLDLDSFAGHERVKKHVPRRRPGFVSSTDWRNGSASDSSPEGYAFESRIGH